MPAQLFKRWVPQISATEQPQVVTRKSSKERVLHHATETLEPAKRPKKRKREAQVDLKVETKEERNSKKFENVLAKYEKASKSAKSRDEDRKLPSRERDKKTPEKLHDLGPMPQPIPVPESDFKPNFSALPPWLSQPRTLEPSKTLPFASLGVDVFFLEKLRKQGFESALAVQTALLPMLRPGLEQHMGDICVSAKTGSGKTLAYLLPIIEALKDHTMPTLSALIIVPSRQLVNQALQVAEDLCTGTKVKIGTAVGSVAFATEQKHLVVTRARYDPKRAQELRSEAAQELYVGSTGLGGILQDMSSMLPGHVPSYSSTVDVLICTPGRLVEHIEHTTGFALNNLRWLVIDEADQLLNQDFQNWTSILMNNLHGETPFHMINAREALSKRESNSKSKWYVALPLRRQLTKVVLSATMEKDLNKLGSLMLQRPNLVVVQDETVSTNPVDNEESVFELPASLNEFAVHVGDGSNKPLYLLHVVRRHVFAQTASLPSRGDASSSSSASGSESDSSQDSDSDFSPDETKESGARSSANRVLIFTKSTESASRLSHLLSILEPGFKDCLKTMTRTLTADASRRLLKSFNTGATKILIASDMASRGLDIPSITHVINYDMPTSITSYVHRVGRTARAGKAGEAWTLFTKTEAAWYLKQVASCQRIKRVGKKVKRIGLKEDEVVTGDKKEAYQAALKQLESAVFEFN